MLLIVYSSSTSVCASLHSFRFAIVNENLVLVSMTYFRLFSCCICAKLPFSAACFAYLLGTRHGSRCQTSFHSRPFDLCPVTRVTEFDELVKMLSQSSRAVPRSLDFSEHDQTAGFLVSQLPNQIMSVCVGEPERLTQVPGLDLLR